MIVHILKLCVGCDSVEELADWQRKRLATGQDLVHVTRQTPRREGVGPQSSLYWVIGGFHPGEAAYRWPAGGAGSRRHIALRHRA